MDDDESYFAYYGQLANQQNMLQDAARTGAYYQAIGSIDCRGKVVLDVGTGSGVLALMAAGRGAQQVFAVEASADAARLAAKLVAANGLSNVVKVVHGRIEDVLAREGAISLHVDVLLSEPVGVLLFHERMVESFLWARKALCPTLLVPSRGCLHFCPFSEPALYEDVRARCGFWQTPCMYGIDLRSLYADALQEAFAAPLIGSVDLSSLLCSQPCSADFDFATLEPKDLLHFNIDCSWACTATGVVHGLAGWFDVQLADAIRLDTSPWSARTHWHQCKLLLARPVAVNTNDRLEGRLTFVANAQRSYDVTLQLHAPMQLSQHWRLQDQQFWNIAPYSEDCAAPSH